MPSSTPAQSAVWSFAAQPQKIGADGTFAPEEYAWYQVPVTRSSLGTITDEQAFPPETGARIVPRGTYRQMVGYGGEIDLVPRLENILGWLLFAALGDVETHANEDIEGNSVPGLYTHVFKFRSTSSYYLPWIASRLLTPGETLLDNSGEVGFDCKIQNLRFTIPQMGKMMIRMGLLGRDVQYANHPGWDYVNTEIEDFDNTPDSGRGSFKLGGVEYPVTGAVVDFVNNLTGPRQQMTLGSFRMRDIIPLSRAVTIRFAVIYENPELCRKIYTGEADALTWSSLPFKLETDGSVKAVDMVFESPSEIEGLSRPYKIGIRGDRAVISKDGPTEITPGDIISESYTVTLIDPASDEEYLEVYLENDTASYSWPELADLVANIAPVLTFASSGTYTGSALVIGPAATVTDADNSFNGASINVLLAGTNYDNTNDAVSVDEVGTVTRRDGEIYVAGELVGYTEGDGKTATPLEVVFNANANASKIQAVLRAIRYNRTSGGTDGHVVTATVTYFDGDGDSDDQVCTITHDIP